MSSIVIFVSLMFIGSSLALNDFQRIVSIKQIHLEIATYVKAVSIIYNGQQALESSSEYRTYTAQLEEIDNAIGIMGFIVSNPQVPSNLRPAETIIDAWRDAAYNVIDKSTTGANQYLQRLGNAANSVSELIYGGIKSATITAMANINRKSLIHDEMKGDRCPIYQKLNSVNTAYGGNSEVFETLYALNDDI